MLSQQQIALEIQKLERGLWKSAQKELIASNEERAGETESSEEEIAKATEKSLEWARGLFAETKENRYILYDIYFILKAKCSRNVTKLAEEMLPHVVMARIKQAELEELRTKIRKILDTEILPDESAIKELFGSILIRYADAETQLRKLQEIKQQTAAAEQQRVASEQRILLLQKQLFELRKQQAKDVKEEGSPQSVGSTSQSGSSYDGPEDTSKKRKPKGTASQTHRKLSRQ